MADDAGRAQQKAVAAQNAATQPGARPHQQEEQELHEHYEEVAEYRIGEGPPPLPLLVAFGLIILWAMISWIPFFGY
jgi:hypothetical protein